MNSYLVEWRGRVIAEIKAADGEMAQDICSRLMPIGATVKSA